MSPLQLLAFTVLYANCLASDEDGGKAPRLPLNDGNSIPALGLGTFLGFDENGQKEVLPGEVEDPVAKALEEGYRLIDTAALYHNEEQIGNGVRKSSVPRENVFVVTKLATNEQRTPIEALKKSLKRLNMTYVDLYLIHFPIAFKPDNSGFDVVDYVDTWKQMEEAKRLGLAKSIGISNFNSSQIERLLEHATIIPSVLQIEVNLNMAQNKLLELAKEHNIVVMAYSPFGSVFQKNSTAPPPREDDPVLVNMANKYSRPIGTIVLRYLVQRGVVPIPKSVHTNRIIHNIEVFRFELTPEEMQTLDKYNKDYRIVWPSYWQDHPYYPFERKDVPDPDIFKGKP